MHIEDPLTPEVEKKNDDLSVVLPMVTRRSALMTYNFLMPGMVARLYYYLFGEIDRAKIATIVDKILERTIVFAGIIDEKKPPLRAIYDYLIENGLLEDQLLSPEAMVYIDQPDLLQQRIEGSPSKLSDEEVLSILKTRVAEKRRVLEDFEENDTLTS